MVWVLWNCTISHLTNWHPDHLVIYNSTYRVQKKITLQANITKNTLIISGLLSDIKTVFVLPCIQINDQMWYLDNEVTQCTSYSQNIENQFSCFCTQKKNKINKKSSVWLASFCLLVWPTTGSECDYWQITSHISTALGFTLNVWSTLVLLSLPLVSKGERTTSKQVCFLTSLDFTAELVSHDQCWKGPEKTHRVQYKPGISQTAASLRVHSVTHASTCSRHTGIHHTNKLECTRTAVKKATHALDWLWSHNRALLF